MGRSEARLSVDIWSPDSDFTDLTPDAQWMYFFLLSQSDLEHTGVIALRERRWARSAAGLTPASVIARLKELERTRYVVIDYETEELLIRSFIRRDKVYRQPNVLRSACDHLPLIASKAILAELRVELQRIADSEDLGEKSAPIIEEMLKAIGDPSPDPPADGHREPTGNPSRNPSGNPSEMPTAATPGDRGVLRSSSSDSPSPVPRSPDPVAPTTPAESSLRPSRASGTRGTRIPDNFGISAEMRTWATEEVPGFDIDREHKRFRDYWRGKSGKDGTKADWPATWRNWMRKACDENPPDGRSRALPSNGRHKPHTNKPNADYHEDF